jgi:hypothetical protein
MPLLKRKTEQTDTLSLRLPVSAKQKLEALRPLADKAGFDLTGSLTDAVVRWIRQVEEELQTVAQATTSPTHQSQHSNDSDHE